MSLTRRTLLGGVTLAGASSLVANTGLAQENATPDATDAGTPGYAITRVRALPTAELNQAIFPNVTHQFLPLLEGAPGFSGYLFGFHDDEPGSSISLSLTTDEAASTAADEAAAGYVGSLDPRFTVETPLARSGPLRAYGVTDRPTSELSPFLHGYKVTVRDRETAPGADIEAVIAQVNDDLLPLMMGMEGFVLYAWIQTETGRVAINIWETADQMAAGDQAVSDFVAQNTVSTTVGEPVVHNGTVGYTSGIV
ncbi:MAG: hypothetical protein KF883_00910 [Thermomicrobiales bacterium]|nr:hypothetical protein [Thermomicrobiales bacterium]